MSSEPSAHSRSERGSASPRRREGTMIWVITGVVLVAIVAAMMLTSRPKSSEAAGTAPDFVLSDTAGNTHRLSDHRGENVLLYFSEGAGCQACLVQMSQIEKQAKAFAARNLTVLPIVMSSREQITRDLSVNGVTTPFLLDDGTVSAKYGTLGKGMHADLPGHSFVLVDTKGQQRWYAEYPSMWIAPGELLREVSQRL